MQGVNATSAARNPKYPNGGGGEGGREGERERLIEENHIPIESGTYFAHRRRKATYDNAIID